MTKMLENIQKSLNTAISGLSGDLILDKLFEMLVIIGLFFFLLFILKTIARKIVERHRDDDPETQSEQEKRAETLSKIFLVTGRLVIFIIAVFMLLRTLEIDIAPLLAGAGVVGIAVGLGAQNLIKDILNGFFILLDNRMRIGDVVAIGDVWGQVEYIDLRNTHLRSLDGTLHMIPNGSIDIISNMTYKWSQVKLDIGVAYKEDIDRVIEILEDIGKQMRLDDDFGRFILEDPQILGLDKFGDSSITISLLLKTMTKKQWAIGREYRRRIKIRFDKEGIDIPFPQRVITQKTP